MHTPIKLILGLIATLLLAAPANAKQYVVHSCKTPAGAVAPTDGWSSNGAATYMWFDNTCAQGGALAAGLAGPIQPANTSTIGWGFHSGDAPIRAYRIVRSGVPRSQNSGASMLLYSSDSENTAHSGKAVDYCAAFRGCPGVAGELTRAVPAIPEDSHAWYFSLVCGGAAGATCTPPIGSDFGNLRIESASFTLEDGEEPQVTAVGGELKEGAATFGALTFQARDQLSGVRRAVLEVDGNKLSEFTATAADARCVETGQSALPDFTYLRPCPERLQIELTLPKGVLAPGEHQLRARVFDAAGNAVTAFGPRQLTIPDPPVTAKAKPQALRIKLDRPGPRSLAFGQVLEISGSATFANGEPAAGRELTLRHFVPAARRAPATLHAVTDSAGRFTLRLRPRASARLTVEDSVSGVGIGQLLTVKANLRLHAARRRIAPLGRLRLRGSFPTVETKRRASIAIKVRAGRRWKTVAVVGASRSGAFSFNYRLRRTRRATFVFRVVALRSSDLAIRLGPSNPVRVRVG